MRSAISTSLVIISTYVICHGLTAYLVTPVQRIVLPEITIFASLMYLPHGVRVLAVWFWGWRAVLPLWLGNYVATIMFTPTSVQDLTAPVFIESMTVSAVSVLLAFELFRLLGRNYYAGQSPMLNWQRLLLIGLISSLINSFGQTLVHSGILPDVNDLPLAATYAVGDLAGLFVCTVVLMFIFRWIRVSQPNE
ncbi:MAG: hypothetical protein HKP40_04865 [Litoreibacter sp.]|nr:hypothetical protein [Litoreibacter sp.]